MTLRSPIDMALATRLTREGRLDEAMAVLRGAAPAPDTAPAPTAPRPSPFAGPGPLIDLAPPVASGGAWSLGSLRPSARPASGSPGMDARTHRGAAGTLAYRLHVPASREAGTALPLIVMLHGCTQSPEDFAAGTRMNAVADELGFAVAWPEQTQSANASRCWNWFQPGDQARGSGEPARVAGIIADLVAEGLVDPDRVTVAGLSAGGAAAAVMGATYPDLIAGVGVHSGLACGAARDMPSAFAAMRSGAPGRVGAHAMPTIALHGDRDLTVAPANGDAVIAQARAGRDHATTVESGTAPGGRAYTVTRHADDDGRVRLEQWALHGAGHAWSGGSAAGSYTDPAGPDASRAIAQFLLAQRREVSAPAR